MAGIVRRPALSAIIAATVVFVAVGCAADKPARAPASQPAAKPQKTKKGRIEGDVEQVALRRKRMKIWGEVREIMRSKHAELPPLEETPTDTDQDPRAEVINSTPYELTVWFVGNCSAKLILAPDDKQTTSFCAGAYHIAAKVASNDFLPLVREDQQFAVGLSYKLTIQIRRQPKQKVRRRWIKTGKPAR